ncbi:MAG: hypothetical protein HFE54_02435 [Turicibacter sp.]|nr:hypothetical protein [Turicibacter sp.]MCI9350779.1 hypothetical protein [Turicibacter sp.]
MKTWMMVLGMSICLAGCDKKVEKQEEVTPSEFKNLLMMDEVHREAYESDVTYQVGDPVIFLDDSGVLWQVTLTSYEVVKDRYAASKEALVLHFNYRYLLKDFEMNETVMPVSIPTVFYEKWALKPQSLAEAKIAYQFGEYEKSPHILYEPVINQEVTCQLVQLKPNKEQNCFSYYSYAGEGNYLISFEGNKKERFNYSLDIKLESNF